MHWQYGASGIRNKDSFSYDNSDSGGSDDGDGDDDDDDDDDDDNDGGDPDGDNDNDDNDTREFKNLLRRWQQERHKTIAFKEKTKALHVRHKFWYITSLYSAKQQSEMTQFKAHDGKFFIQFLCQLQHHSRLFCYWIVQPQVECIRITAKKCK